MSYSRLFSPMSLGPLALANRLVHTATLPNYAERNLPTERHAQYYGARARGGVGLIVSEAICVHPTAVPTAVAIRGDDPAALPGLRRIAEAVHAHGVPILAQLWHMGRQQLWTPISAPWAPSPVPDPMSGTVPHEMSLEEIDEVIAHYAATARLAREAGFDGVEIHGAHGYLVTQFLSPWSNRRQDEYGGPLENRLRFLERVLEAVRGAIGRESVAGLKMNGDELVEGGIDLPEAQRIAARLAETRALDYLAVSQGNFSKSLDAHCPDMHFPRLAFRALARGVREAAGGVPVCAMARIATPEDAEEVLRAGDADLIGMSRALIADPELPRKAREGRAAEIRPCIACNVCWGTIAAGKPMLCIYNPSVGAEATIDADRPPRAAATRRIVVVGGGLAGLEASRVAALRGHRVMLLERGPALGGQALLAARLPGRAEFGEMTRWLVRQVEGLPIEVRLGAEATVEMVRALAPDAVVLATGARSPELDPGPGPVRVLSSWQAVEQDGKVGARVVVIDRIGEHEGPGVAELVAAQAERVWLVTPLDLVGPYVNYVSRIGVMRRLLARNVAILTGSEVVRRSGHAVLVRNLYSGQTRRLRQVDALVVVGPNQAETALLAGLRAAVPELHVIGDCYAPRAATSAVHEGHRVGRLL